MSHGPTVLGFRARRSFNSNLEHIYTENETMAAIQKTLSVEHSGARFQEDMVRIVL